MVFIGVLALLGVAALTVHLAARERLQVPAVLGLQAALDLVLLVMTIVAGRVVPMFTNNGVPGTGASKNPVVEWLAPAAVASNVTTMALSRLTFVEVRVGWGRPCYDFLPGDDPLLAAGGQLFATGIYAHAPARHRYELAGGWRRLTGTCGLPNGRGSVDFIIRADGREVFRSGKLEDGRTKTFAVELIGVQTLELITDEAGDGNGSDWGLWLGAELTR